MKKLLCLICALFFTVLSFAHNKQFDTMIVFGDSLSDNGNLYRYLWNKVPVSPPYYKGHFSNGPVWAELLYDSYFPAAYPEGFQNYAVGGAGAVLSYKQYLPYTLTMELDNYLYWHTYGKKDSSLYTIWIGGNNYLNGPSNVESITDSVVNALANTVERIISHGGDKFFIPNLPDLGSTPYAVEMQKPLLLSQLTQEHNRKLAEKIDFLKQKYPEVTFVAFDVYALFHEATSHALDYGFSNTQDPCYLGGYTGWLVHNKPTDKNLQLYLSQLDKNFDAQNWALINNNPQLKEAAISSYLYQLLPEKNKEEALNCDAYIFWDRVHPSTKAHVFIAEKARQALDEAGLQSFVPGE